MNGAEKKIYDAIVENGKKIIALETTQRLNHKSNLEKLAKVENIPCGAHSAQINWLWGLFCILLIAIIGVYVK